MRAKELNREKILLDKRGKLTHSFWATEEETEYNRDKASKLRLREWEQLQLMGKSFVFRILFGHFGSMGLCKAAFTDLRTGSFSASGPFRFFSGDAFALDQGLSQAHHFLIDEDDFFLSLDDDGSFLRLRCLTGSIDVELMMPDSAETLFSAAPFENLHRFFYAGRRVYPELRGQVAFRGREYSLKNAFCAAESCRAVLPLRCHRVYCSGSLTKEGHSLSLILGWGFGYASAGLENALLVDGQIIKLNRVHEKRGKSYLSPCRFLSEDGSVELLFTPLRDELFSKDFRLLYFRSHCTVGTASGKVNLGGWGTVEIDSMPMLCEHSQFCF